MSHETPTDKEMREQFPDAALSAVFLILAALVAVLFIPAEEVEWGATGGPWEAGSE